MNVTLWIMAGVLAVGALVSGSTKVFVPLEKLSQRESAAWTRNASPALVRSLGVLEIMASVGLILPAVVDIAPVMVPITATCWVVLMIGATITHGRLGQWKLALVTLAYLAIAALIAVGRFGPESFSR